ARAGIGVGCSLSVIGVILVVVITVKLKTRNTTTDEETHLTDEPKNKSGSYTKQELSNAINLDDENPNSSNGDYDLIKQKEVETNWEYLISDASDVHVAATNFTNSFLNIASDCIHTREVTMRCDDRMPDVKRENATGFVIFLFAQIVHPQKRNLNNKETK
ncbi:Hypothetical predicted protein, partial [Mytilus galloprovincialis]